SSRRRHTRFSRDWSSDVCSSDLRVEGLASALEWQRAYGEINRFEQSLVEHQTVIIKIWLAISKEEQAARFKAREETPHKRFKIRSEERRVGKESRYGWRTGDNRE